MRRNKQVDFGGRSQPSALWAASILTALSILPVGAKPPPALAPPVSLTAGASWHSPVDFATSSSPPHGGLGTRIGLAFPASLPAGNLDIPVEWGLTLRTASIRFDDHFDRMVFTDLQAPVLFHGAPFAWKPLEVVAAWTPSYTLDLVSTSPDGGRIAGGDDLRTRFNMGFGGGLQLSVQGFRIRSYAVYNIFPVFAGSTFKTTDWVFEAAIPLLRRKPAP